MPIYSRHQIFCVPKEIIEKKFKGGIDGFRSLFIKEEFKANKEDDHLFCIVESEENFKTLENNGLSFEENDFEFISRYDKGPNLISLASNYAWVYHISTPKIQVVLVNYLCSMTMDVIGKKVEEGVILDETITDKTINTNKFYQEVLNNLSKEEKAKLSFDKFNGSGLANKNNFNYNKIPDLPKFTTTKKITDKNSDLVSILLKELKAILQAIKQIIIWGLILGFLVDFIISSLVIVMNLFHSEALLYDLPLFKGLILTFIGPFIFFVFGLVLYLMKIIYLIVKFFYEES